MKSSSDRKSQSSNLSELHGKDICHRLPKKSSICSANCKYRSIYDDIARSPCGSWLRFDLWRLHSVTGSVVRINFIVGEPATGERQMVSRTVHYVTNRLLVLEILKTSSARTRRRTFSSSRKPSRPVKSIETKRDDGKFTTYMVIETIKRNLKVPLNVRTV